MRAGASFGGFCLKAVHLLQSTTLVQKSVHASL
jgi:hypothetical protein